MYARLGSSHASGTAGSKLGMRRPIDSRQRPVVVRTCEGGARLEIPPRLIGRGRGAAQLKLAARPVVAVAADAHALLAAAGDARVVTRGEVEQRRLHAQCGAHRQR
eukprot:scaffold92835_cov66-Phaeocystis_antarctica.AAC.2